MAKAVSFPVAFVLGGSGCSMRNLESSTEEELRSGSRYKHRHPGTSRRQAGLAPRRGNFLGLGSIAHGRKFGTPEGRRGQRTALATTLPTLVAPSPRKRSLRYAGGGEIPEKTRAKGFFFIASATGRCSTGPRGKSCSSWTARTCRSRLKSKGKAPRAFPGVGRRGKDHRLGSALAAAPNHRNSKKPNAKPLHRPQLFGRTFFNLIAPGVTLRA